MCGTIVGLSALAWWISDSGLPLLIGELNLLRSLQGVSLRYTDEWCERGFALSEDLPLPSCFGAWFFNCWFTCRALLGGGDVTIEQGRRGKSRRIRAPGQVHCTGA